MEIGHAAEIGPPLGLVHGIASRDRFSVPVLVYLFGRSEREAIAGSLTVVATVASRTLSYRLDKPYQRPI